MVSRLTIRKNRWSLLSMLITVGNALLISFTVEYLYQRGIWRANPRLDYFLSSWGGMAVLLSLVTALIGLARDESPGFSIFALCLRVFSAILHVRLVSRRFRQCGPFFVV